MTLLLSGASPESSVFAWGVLANNVGVFRYAIVIFPIWCSRYLMEGYIACGHCLREMA
jgi:hypothetical protein